MSNNTKTILCVEDEKDLRENISFYLNQKGFRIIEASDGEEAYTKYIANKPDIILCDINMPKMNGHQFLEKISSDFPERKNQIPFIFLTALGQKNDFIKGLDLGADEYVIKPIDFEVLLSMINSKLAKSDFNKQFTDAKLNQFCNQVSNLLPNEIKEPLDSIIKFSSTLKKESFGAFIEPKYVDLATKIYISALKLNFQVSKALNESNIKKEAEILKDEINFNDLLNTLKSVFNQKQLSFSNNNDLLVMMGNYELLKSNLVSYLNQHIQSNAREIALDIFLDYQKNLVICISCFTSLPVICESVEQMLNLHNGKFSTIVKEEKTYHLLTFPNYLIKK
ncbi:MAG: response regulator [Rickettsiales bacterium]|nr:response regulator [Rickettsiales bacterium]